MRLAIKTGASFLVCEAAGEAGSWRIVGAASLSLWDRKPNLWDMLCEGLLEWPFRWGLASLQRALTTDEKLVKADHDEPPAGQLSMVAVCPLAQGGGIGSNLVHALLQKWDSADGRALVLSTQRSRNLPFYERQGAHSSSHPVCADCGKRVHGDC